MRLPVQGRGEGSAYVLHPIGPLEVGVYRPGEETSIQASIHLGSRKKPRVATELPERPEVV